MDLKLAKGGNRSKTKPGRRRFDGEAGSRDRPESVEQRVQPRVYRREDDRRANAFNESEL